MQSWLGWKGSVFVNVGAENVRELVRLRVHHFGFTPVDVQLRKVAACRGECVGVVAGGRGWGIASGRDRWPDYDRFAPIGIKFQ